MKIKRFFKNVMVFFTGDVLSKLVALFLLPLYTSKILPEQYGTYDLIISIVYLIAPVAFVQVWEGLFRFSFDYTEKSDKYKVINNASVVFVLGLVVYVLLFLTVAQFFNAEYIEYALFYGFAYTLQYIYSFAARAFFKNKLFSLSGVINALTSALCNIVLILVFKWDVKALYVSQIVGIVVQVAIIEVNLKLIKNFKRKDVDKGIIKTLVKYSFPLCVSSVSYWLLNSFTKVIIDRKLGAYYNGLYVVTNKFSSTLVILSTVFQYAWNELAFLMVNEEDKTKSYSTCADLMFKTVFFGSAVITILIKLIFPLFVAEQYGEAINIVPATILGVGMNCLAGMLGTLFMAEKNTSFILISTLVAATINTVASWFLCVYIGLNGVLIILAVAFTLLMVLRLVTLRVKYKITIKLDNLLVILVYPATVVAYYLIDSILLSIGVVIVFMALYLLSIKGVILKFLKSKSNKGE